VGVASCEEGEDGEAGEDRVPSTHLSSVGEVEVAFCRVEEDTSYGEAAVYFCCTEKEEGRGQWWEGCGLGEGVRMCRFSQVPPMILHQAGLRPLEAWHPAAVATRVSSK
jgi:hypothetical protein